MSATASAIGAAYKIPSIPVPEDFASNMLGNTIASGVKHTISRINDATMAWIGFSIDWKKIAVILIRQVTVIRDR